MFDQYRAWLESELRLLGNASHHAYSFGQANMAKRALERFDEAVAASTADGTRPVHVVLPLDEARAGLDALDSAGSVPALVALRERLVEALGRHEANVSNPAAGAFVTPLDPSDLVEKPRP